MPTPTPWQISATGIIRSAFATATAAFLILGVVVDDGTKLYAISGTCGAIWWAWDLLVEHVLTPLEYWVEDMLVGGRYADVPPKVPIDARLNLLESRLARGSSRRLDFQAAMRLAELYRFQKKDVAQARRVIDVVKARYPDAPELAKLEAVLP